MIAKIRVTRKGNPANILGWNMYIGPSPLDYLKFLIGSGGVEWSAPPGFEIPKAEDLKIEIDFELIHEPGE